MTKGFCSKFLTFLILSAIFSINNLPLSADNTYSQSSGTVTETGKTYGSSTTDLSAVKVIGGIYNISYSNISSTGGVSSADNSSFYGLNAVMLVYATSGTPIINSNNNYITSSGEGANGIFAYGKGICNSVNDTIYCTGRLGHGIMCSGGGTISATNLIATTKGPNSGVIATDRGSGTISVNGAVIRAEGADSPGIYSTGIISVNNAEIVSTGAEAAVIEGANFISLTDVNLSSSYDNKWGVIIYQSMSGDAEGTNGYYSQTNGSLAYTGTNGPLLFVTNSTGHYSFNNCSLSVTSGILLSAAATTKWGTTGQNGGNAELCGTNQVFAGNILVDNISTLTVSLKESSTLTGAIDAANTGKETRLEMDGTSNWTVTANSYLDIVSNSEGISGLNCSNITGNGNNVYYDSEQSENAYLNALTYNLVNGGVLTPLKGSAVDENAEQLNSVLKQNYPNPVTNQTTFSYSINSPSQVNLSIYDIFGRKVETLVEQFQEIGEYNINWTPNLINGIYYFQLKYGDKVITKQLSINK